MTVAQSITITPESTGTSIHETITTGADYKWLVIYCTSPMLIMSYEVENTGANAVDFKIIGARGQVAFDPASERFADVVAETAVASGESNEADAAGIDVHHRTIAIGVKSSVASEAHVVLGVSV